MTIDKRSVLSALKEAGSRGLKSKDIAKYLGVKSRQYRALKSLLDELEQTGAIVRGRRRRYLLPEYAGYLTGRFIGYGRSVGLLVSLDGSEVLRVSGESLESVSSGDLVVARVAKGRSGEKEARILRIVERGSTSLIGQMAGDRRKKVAYVSRNRRYRSVAISDPTGAKAGDYVVVRVGQGGEPYERTSGRIIEVLGGHFSPGEDFASIVREFNLPVGFPQEVENEVEAIRDEIPEEEKVRRRDLTDLLTFTIDPADAKDFDDAISVESIDNGTTEIGVHIADVSHYVRQDSWLDRDAMARGRSVYLVDRVIPMLPHKLSSEVAALQPNKPRLALSVVMRLNRDGDVKDYEIFESIIQSKARLNYEEAQSLIERGAGWRAPRLTKKIANALKLADELAHRLKEKRIERGAIELETPELDIVIDDSGKVVDLKPAARLASHDLIEELMVLANETVANHMAYLGRSFIYRVHEVPAEKDMRELSQFASAMGYRFRWSRGTSPRALQALIEKVKGKAEQYIVSMFLLRSLKKARYSERNVGHFGLASKCYTHFTSPIRRYPDLIVHRLLKIYGLTKASPRDPKRLTRFLRQVAEIASTKEVEGDEAERASIKARVAEYMSRHVGEEYWGVISGVQDFGFFVMLEDTLVEGLVHVATLDDDYYSLDATGTMLVGSRSGRCYRIGDRVLVRVDKVSRADREVDFSVIATESDRRVERRVARSRSSGVVSERVKTSHVPHRLKAKSKPRRGKSKRR